MLQNIVIVIVVILTGGAFLSRQLASSTRWRAMVTPLASIIGSGFLVLGPILDASYGYFAPAVMAMLCISAYLFGWTIRFNIQALEKDAPRGQPT